MSNDERSAIVFEVRVHEFTKAMESHQISHTKQMPGEHVYYLTEMWVMWQDGMYDAEHSYILN